MGKLVKIALTGGPCAGKSSAEKFLKTKLKDAGWSAVFIPEAATRIIRQYGFDPTWLAKHDRKTYLEFQQLLMETQLQEEAAAVKNAIKFYTGQNTVIICDRGIIDCAAYVKPEEFRELTRRLRLKKAEVRDQAYEAVFHLVTAAEGAEAHYNRDNSARIEDLAQARESDQRVQSAWLGHPHLRIIDNSTGIDGKNARLLAKILKALGVPEKIETERKFLVSQAPDPSGKNFPIPFEDVEIYQTYLAGEQKVRLRKRGNKEDGYVFFETRKRPTDSEASSVEIERVISEREYWQKRRQRDTRRDELHKIRRHFVWKNQYFELDMFKTPKRLENLTLLEIELTREDDHIEIPEWLGPVREVTSEGTFKNRKLAKRPQ